MKTTPRIVPCRARRALRAAASFRTTCVIASGLNGLPFSMPIDLSVIDHRLVAREPQLALHEAVERLEEAQVVGIVAS